MRPVPLHAALVATALPLLACTCRPPDNGDNGTGDRCPFDLKPFTAETGGGASARPIDDPKDLMQGDAAQGRVGDFLLFNDRIKLVIQQPDRHPAPLPYGGNIIDAGLVGAEGGAWDTFGAMGLFYNFGRTVDVTKVEVLTYGSGAGSAVIAATGRDALNDNVNIGGMLKRLLAVDLAVDPEAAQTLLFTHYYVLSPGDSFVRVITAVCNEGTDAVTLPVGDLIDSGGAGEMFNPLSCTKGFGYGICLDDFLWFGWQGRSVAYGYAPYAPGTGTPSLENATMTVSGITGTLLGADGQAGLLAWTDPNVRRHKGELVVPPSETRAFMRDFVVGRDLGEVSTAIHAIRSELVTYPVGEVKGTVTRGGQPVKEARVVAFRPAAFTPKGPPGAEGPLKNPRAMAETVFVTDTAGQFRGRLPIDTYRFSAWAPGSAPTAETTVAIGPSGVALVALDLAVPRKLTVKVSGVGGDPLPAKVTVRCTPPSGSTAPVCPAPVSKQRLYRDVLRDPLPDTVQELALVPPSGQITLELPPAAYDVSVTRGPQYSMWPLSGPPGERADLTSADATVSATLVKVVDSAGWTSADLHVHAVNSPDAYVANRDRVLSYLAEGVDVLVSADHDYVTDYASLVADVGGQGLLATVAGEEVSPFDFGHFVVFPMKQVPTEYARGAIDWAGGRDATLRPEQIVQAARAVGARTVQVNHPRGALGLFTQLRLDTDTLATHTEPGLFRMAPADGATASNTRLFPASGFDAIEVMNPGVDEFNPVNARPQFNDWFVLLSRGLVLTGTAASDTHQVWSSAAGYPRTFVRTGWDSVAAFDPGAMSSALNAHRAMGTTGPFLVVKAHRLDAAGSPEGPDAEVGDVLANEGRDVELVIEVQTASWYDVTHLEVLTHAGTTGSCAAPPVPPTSRIACNGVANANWPTDGIAASIDLVPAEFLAEKVAEIGGVAVNRIRLVKRVRLPAPTRDTWFVVTAEGTREMFPAAYASVKNGDPVPVRPFAFSNPIFIDADGGGYGGVW